MECEERMKMIRK